MKRSQAPRILAVVDTPRWAFDQKARNLRRVLDDDYDIVKCFGSSVDEVDLDRADLILSFGPRLLASQRRLAAALERNRHKLLIGISSHYGLEGQRRARGLAALRRCARAVFANNLFLYREFQPLLDVPVYYTPNGVDTAFYCPDPDPSPRREPGLRVGWAGSLTNQGPAQRGFYDLIVPATGAVQGVQLVTAIREERWRNPEQMRDFYRSLDVYLCASRNEGTPNPCLEAAACGVPLVTTPVGNMPELIRHGENGLFIERDVADIAAKLAALRDDPGLRARLGRALLASIRTWDWTRQVDHYRRMFEATLAGVEVVGQPEPTPPTPSPEAPAALRAELAESEQAVEALLTTVARRDRTIADLRAELARVHGSPSARLYRAVRRVLRRARA